MQETQETQVQTLGQEDPLAVCSSILACKIPWTEEAGMLQSRESDMTETLCTYIRIIKRYI